MRRNRLKSTLWCPLFVVFLALGAVTTAYGQYTPRISVAEAVAKISAGKALLVCSYHDSQCQRVRLKDALLMSQLEEQLPSLPKKTEIIFYCL